MRNCILLALCFTMLIPIALFADDNGGGIRVQTIKVSSVSPFLTLKFWDYEAEDGDWVRIVVDGETYREFELKNAPKTVSIPILFSDKDEVLVNVIGTKSGNGPVTYAVQATGLGSSVEVYKNYADVGSGNSYRIVKTKDDIFSVGVNFLAWLFGIGNEKVSETRDEDGTEIGTLGSCAGTGLSTPESFDLTRHFVYVGSKSEALDLFRDYVRTRPDRKDGCVEYTAYVIEREGEYYLSPVARTSLRMDDDNPNVASAESPRVQHFGNDKIVMQIHSHPEGKNFSTSDIMNVQNKQRELVLVDQTSGREAILTPKVANGCDLNDEDIRTNGIKGTELDWWYKWWNW